MPAGPIGLTSSAPFQTFSGYENGGGTLATSAEAVEFSYSAADNRYTISLPGFQPGQLITKGGSGGFNGNGWTDLRSTFNGISLGSSSDLQRVNVNLDWPASSTLRYTSAGSWSAPEADHAQGVFAYGIPTSAGDVPLTGSANYAGSVRGLTNNGLDVWGSVSLSFDFGAATLSGVMKPSIAPIWDEVSLGDYAFQDTVFVRGATSFSGAFNVSGTSARSSFNGNFTGLQAAELMANWSAPYRNPLNDQWGTMVGVWTAKKP